MNVLTTGLEPMTVSLLRSRNFLVDTEVIVTAQSLESYLETGLYDACVITLTKGGFGLAVPQALRFKKIHVPLIGILTNSNEHSWSEHRAAFLEYGGDDLLCEADPRELAASLHAIARRSNINLESKLEYHIDDACLKIDTISQQATINNVQIPLFVKETELLMIFARTPNRILTEDSIISKMFAHRIPESNVISVHVYRLRKQLRSAHPRGDKFIRTIRGKGYIFQPQNIR